jgi:hypothetical protein
VSDLLSDETWCNKVAFLDDISQTLNSLNKSRHENILTCRYKITSFKEKVTLWGSQNQKWNKLKMFQLAKYCRLGKNFVDLILQNFSLLSKIIEKYFPSLNASSLDWERDPFVISAFESAELTAAEDDELTEVRNDNTETEALFDRYGLILVVSPTGVHHRQKDGD